MSEIFQGYEKQYQDAAKILKQGCAGAAALGPEQRRAKLLEMRTAMEDADSLIRRMDLEARGLNPNQRAGFLSKLKEYKAEITNLKREYKGLCTGETRDALFEGTPATMTASEEQRIKLARATDKMYQTGDRIKEGRRVLVETEELGVNILQDLHRQRETLMHASNTLHGVDDNIARGKLIIHNISKSLTRNKYIVGGLIGFLLIAILLVASGKKHN